MALNQVNAFLVSSSRISCMDNARVPDEFWEDDDPYGLDSIQDGEDPPFDSASMDSVCSRLSDTPGPSTTNRLPLRTRLVKMDEIIERLWDPVVPCDVAGGLDPLETSRSNFFRSMVNTPRGPDVDLTATWHQALDSESIEGDRRKRTVALAKASSSWKMHEAPHQGKPRCRYSPQLDTDTPLDTVEARALAWVESSRAMVRTTAGSEEIKRHCATKDIKTKKKRWSLGRCFGSIRQTLCGDKPKVESPTIGTGRSNMLSYEESSKQYTSHVVTNRSDSDLSSVGDLYLRGYEPHEIGSPFLTTSALFDDPRTPQSFCMSHQSTITMEGLSITQGELYEKAMKWDMNGTMASEEDEMNLSELWDASDMQSTRSSIMYRDMFWTPPVLKTDKEYEMQQMEARIRASNLGRSGFERPRGGDDGCDDDLSDSETWSWRSSSLSYEERSSMRDESYWNHENMGRIAPNSTTSSECDLENVRMTFESSSSQQTSSKVSGRVVSRG